MATSSQSLALRLVRPREHHLSLKTDIKAWASSSVQQGGGTLRCAVVWVAEDMGSGKEAQVRREMKVVMVVVVVGGR